MSYLLIDWVDELPKTYSVVLCNRLEDESLRSDPSKLVGKTVQILWNRGKSYPGLVLKIGNELVIAKFYL